MPQLPPTETTATGFTLVTDSLLRTSYRSSLGFIEFRTATMYSSLPSGSIKILSTGSSFLALSTQSGTLVVQGGIGVGANMYIEQDIVVNELEIGKGFEGTNNIRFSGTATALQNDFNVGQQSIIIGYDSLKGISTAFRNIAIGTKALSSGTNLRSSIAIGDDSLKNAGTINYYFAGTVTNATITSSTAITSVTNENPMKIVSPLHGLTSGTQIYVTGVVGITTSSISTGVYSLINTQTLYVGVINPNTLAAYYDSTLTVTVNATSATSYVSGGTLRTPVKLTVTTPNLLETGKFALLTDLVGLNPLNNVEFYVKKLSANTVTLYNDPILREATDGTGIPPYISGGKLLVAPARASNISYGHSSGEQLTDGENNIFIGNESGQYLTTGSHNIIIGNNKAFDLFKGSGIISIGGDNIVNGVDNQINIGSILYYNGTNLLEVRPDTTKFGNLTQESTSTSTGAVVVAGGVGISGNLNIGNNLTAKGQVNCESVKIEDAVFDSTSTTITSTATSIIDVYSLSQFRSAKYFVQITDGSGTTAKFQAQEITVLANNTGTAYISTYGLVSNSGPLGNFDATVNGTDVRLQFTPTNPTTKVIKVLRTSMAI
jgi:hypothetical protein